MILYRTRFEVAWVPSHGRARHRHVRDVWRLLNNAADHAAEDVYYKHSLARTVACASSLSRRRRLALLLLSLTKV